MKEIQSTFILRTNLIDELFDEINDGKIVVDLLTPSYINRSYKRS